MVQKKKKEEDRPHEPLLYPLSRLSDQSPHAELRRRRRPGRPPDRNHDKAWGQGDLQPQRPLLHSASQAPGPPPPHSGGGPRPLSRRRAGGGRPQLLPPLPRAAAPGQCRLGDRAGPGDPGGDVRLHRPRAWPTPWVPLPAMWPPHCASVGLPTPGPPRRPMASACRRIGSASPPPAVTRIHPSPPSARSSSPWTCAGA